MKITKKIVALLFCLILVTVQITVIAQAQAEDGVNVFYATFSINLHNNRLMSRYGVTVYLDDIEVGRMEQGDLLTFGAYMTDDRPHVLTIVADKAGVPVRTWTISNLQHGSVFTVEIQAKRNQVKVLSYELSLNGQELCSVSPDMEKRVKLLGTVIVTGLNVYKAMK